LAGALLCALLFFFSSSSSTALSLEASSHSLVDCNNLAQESYDGRLRYLKAHQLRQDPGKTFDDAVSSCLDFITGFQVGIPTMWDGMLAAMIKQLMQRGCQAARGQFDKAVNDAMQSVNGGVGMIPGVSVGTSSQAGVSVRGDNGSMMQSTANKVVDRVVNTIK
jgi:hypothetical protein